MNRRDFDNFGQFGNIIRDAVDSMDFNKLNQTMRSRADDMIFGDRRGDKGYGRRRGSYGHPYNQSNWQTYRRPQRRRRNSGSNAMPFLFGSLLGSLFTSFSSNTKSPNMKNTDKEPAAHTYKVDMPPVDYGFPVARAPKGEASGALLSVFGILGMVLTGAGFFWYGFQALIFDFSFGFLGGLAAVLMLVFCVMLILGTKQKNRVKRFRRYIDFMKGKAFATFADLASLVGKSKSYILRDVCKMLDLGYFPQGHVDAHKTCLMATDSIYQQYLETMKNAKANSEAAGGTSAAANTNKEKMSAEELKNIKDMKALGKEYMSIIRKANDDIPDTQISNKLYRMETIIGKIFEQVEAHPKQADRLSQFQNYYMPMTIKLVETYRDMDREQIQGENISKVKTEIAGSLDVINEAYEKLYDSLYQETAMDVSSDITVLHTLLAQEGLTKGAFDKKSREEKKDE